MTAAARDIHHQRGDAAAATFAVGTRVRLREERRRAALRAFAVGRDYGREGRVLRVTRSPRYGHAYVYVAWDPRATYPSGTYRYLDGQGLEVLGREPGR